MLTAKRKYEIWLTFLENVQPNEWFYFMKSGNEKDEIIEALKSLHDHFGIVQFSSDYKKYMRIDPLSMVRELVGEFGKTGAEAKYIQAKKELDDFYTKSYNPENMEAQKKEWETRNAEAKAREAIRVAQANDLPLSGVSGHPEKDNAVSALKIAKNENNKSNENTEW